jgi:uncharacterized repeat protein (TIGR01451 family)
MANRSEFGRAGPTTRGFPGGKLRPVIGFAALALLVAACTESTPTAGKIAVPPKPLADANAPFNDEGRCLAADAYWSAAVTGVNDSLKLADPTKSCTANDIRIARIDLKRFKIGNGDFQDYVGQPVLCDPGQALQLDIDSHVQETATSQRTDVGIWIGLEGSNARTGTCNHYNLVNPIPPATVTNGVNNDDSDQCGDITLARESIVSLGIIDAICQTSQGSADSLHIGSCLGWTQPGGDQVCPQTTNKRFGDVTGSNGFRFGTVPGTTSKCNCEGFNVPILVAQKAFLEVKKVCDPTGDTGTFDLLINGSTTATSNNALCGTGTTGKVELGAGTSAVPGQVHTFGEGDFTTANYTSSFVCANRGGGSHAPASGTSLGPNNITLLPNEDVVCTYTNVRLPQVKLVKDLVPDNDAGKFNLTIAGTTFNNGGAGFGDQGTTGFQNVAIGTVNISEAATSGTGTNISEYGSALACNSGKTVSNNTGTSGSITVAAGDQVTCTFTNTHSPRLGLFKTPDPGGTGYTVNPGQTATFTITITDSLGGGPALNVAIIDTLPADVGNWTEDPDQTECTITALSGEAVNRLLQCSFATGGAPNELVQLNPGSSFTVVVKATVPNNFLQIPPDPNGPTAAIEIEGDLLDDPAVPGKDWGTAGLISCLNPPGIKGCDIDLPTGSSDNSFGQGTSEDDGVPTVVTGSIPNNKSDLLRFYIANERVNISPNPLVAHDFLYLAWERVQEPQGTTNMDFELNQGTALTSNGVTPVRQAGDILIKYDLSQGGTTPVLGFHRWILSGTCQKNGGKAPCWGPVQTLSAAQGVIGAINTGPVDDPINPGATRTLSARTFGEARIDLQLSGIFQPGSCLNFGRAYLKSRSSDSFAAEIKDFIAPIPIQVQQCAPRDLNNRVWARAANFAPPGGALNAWFSDTGQIHVQQASAARFTTPTNLRLAHVGLMFMVPVGTGRRQRFWT